MTGLRYFVLRSGVKPNLSQSEVALECGDLNPNIKDILVQSSRTNVCVETPLTQELTSHFPMLFGIQPRGGKVRQSVTNMVRSERI